MCFGICSLTENKKTIHFQTATFVVWEELDLEQPENTGFVYQECNFLKLLLNSIKLGVIRPYRNSRLKYRLSQQEFLERIDKVSISNKIILKSKVKIEFGKIIDRQLIAMSIYSEKGKFICSFDYEEVRENWFLDNPEAMICLGEGLKIPLTEVFENRLYKTTLLRKKKYAD